MKRSLALAAVVAAVFVPAAPASADHLCVTSGGRPLLCLVDDDPRQICVFVGGDSLLCVF